MLDGIIGPSIVSPTEALATARVRDFQQSRDHEDIRRAALEYESYFLSFLMKSMRATVPKGSLTANPMGQEFISFYDEEIGKRAAQSGGIGLADFVLSSLAEEPSQSSSQDSPKPSR